ncbi:MAG: response regulator [Chloroflexota bacterium]|nr:MAG: response regulator [Chloroflexota bacterium]
MLEVDLGYADGIGRHTAAGCQWVSARQEEGAVDTEKNVLVVDDDPCIVELLAAMLTLEGYQISKATSAEQALELAYHRVPDVIVLDWMMPETDGIELCRIFKKRVETSLVPVIVISANDRVRSASREAGADGWLLKPFDLDDLLTTVRKSLVKSTTARA